MVSAWLNWRNGSFMSDFDDIPPVRLVAGRIRWNGRLAPYKLRDLYENDAAGMHDEELLDDVATTFYARCISISAVTKAHFGDITCAACLDNFRRDGWDKELTMTCPECGWACTWGDYLRSYQKRQLFGGNAQTEYWKFLDDYPLTQGYTEKMKAVDRVVHAFHQNLKNDVIGRSAAVNLVEGSMKVVLDLLDSLDVGAASTEGVAETWESYDKTVEKIPWLMNIRSRNERRK